MRENATEGTNQTITPAVFAAIHGKSHNWIIQLLNVRRIEGARRFYGYWRIPVGAKILPPKTPGTLPLKRLSKWEVDERRAKKAAEAAKAAEVSH
jgi:hypothetical protein